MASGVAGPRKREGDHSLRPRVKDPQYAGMSTGSGVTAIVLLEQMQDKLQVLVLMHFFAQSISAHSM